MKYSVLVIVAGLVLEVLLALRHPPYNSSLAIWGPIIANALVAIGVYVEFLFAERGSLCQSEIVERSRERATYAVQEALAANERAALANERAAVAHQEALHAEIALAAYRAPWRIAGEEYAALVEKLTPFSPQRFLIHAVYNHTDSMNFSARIRSLLKDAGWTDTHPQWLLQSGEWRDIQVDAFEVDDDNTTAAGPALVQGLRAIGIAAEYRLLPAAAMTPQNTVRIAIGSKH